jgi:hypothetical protein
MNDENNSIILNTRRSSRRNDSITVPNHTLMSGLNGQTELFNDSNYVDQANLPDRCCAICLLTLEGVMALKQLPNCIHRLHKLCFDESISNGIDTCPECRT